MLIFHHNMLEIVGWDWNISLQSLFFLFVKWIYFKITSKRWIPTIFSHQHLQNLEKTTVFCCYFNVLHPGSFPSVTFFFARSLDVLTSQFLRVMEEVPKRWKLDFGFSLVSKAQCRNRGNGRKNLVSSKVVKLEGTLNPNEQPLGATPSRFLQTLYKM